MKHLTLLAGLILAVSACDQPAPTQLDDVEPAFARVNGKAVVNSARGSGNISSDAPGRVLTFTAKEHADGSISGHILLHFPTAEEIVPSVRAEVTCMRVDGNVAFIGGRNLPNSGWEGDVGFWVEDNGQGNADDPDRASLMWVNLAPGDATRVCDGSLLPGPTLEVFRGNIQVN